MIKPFHHRGDLVAFVKEIRGYEHLTDAVDAMIDLLKQSAGEAIPVSPTPDWQPIETAPKDADVLLLWADGWGVQPGYWDSMDDDESEHRWIAVETQGLTGGKFSATHWMPLPASPSAVLSSASASGSGSPR